MSLIKPESKEEFIEHCKLRIGYPVTKLQLNEFQYEVRVKEALELFSQYHYQALEHVWVAHQFQQSDINSASITVPDHVKYVTRVLTLEGVFSGTMLIDANSAYVWSNPVWSSYGGGGKFDTGSSPLMQIFLLKNHIANYENTLYAEDKFHFNEYTRRLQIDASWKDKFRLGNYIVYEGYSTLEDIGNSKFWSNDWLIRYTCELFMLQWGINMSKFKDIRLPSGHVLAAADIKTEAERKIEELKAELRSSYVQYQQIFVG